MPCFRGTLQHSKQYSVSLNSHRTFNSSEGRVTGWGSGAKSSGRVTFSSDWSRPRAASGKTKAEWKYSFISLNLPVESTAKFPTCYLVLCRPVRKVLFRKGCRWEATFHAGRRRVPKGGPHTGRRLAGSFEVWRFKTKTYTSASHFLQQQQQQQQVKKLLGLKFHFKAVVTQDFGGYKLFSISVVF